MISKRIALYLMNEKGYYTLQRIIETFGREIIEYVVTSEDKNVQNDFTKEIVSVCCDNSVEYYYKGNDIPEFEGYSFAIGWRWIIQENNERLIVFHDSLLPKYRGFAPLANMLINGESKIGVSALYAAEEYDAGDIIMQRSADITYPIKIENAINIIKELYFENARAIIENVIKGKRPEAFPQDPKQATFSPWRDSIDYEIDWADAAERTARKVDAVGFPYAGAYTFLNGMKVYIDEALSHPEIRVEAAYEHIGKVLFIKKDFPYIICGTGVLEITAGHYENGSSLLPIKKFRSRFGK